MHEIKCAKTAVSVTHVLKPEDDLQVRSLAADGPLIDLPLTHSVNWTRALLRYLTHPSASCSKPNFFCSSYYYRAQGLVLIL